MKRGTARRVFLGVVLTTAVAVAASTAVSNPVPAAHAGSGCSGLLQGLQSWVETPGQDMSTNVADFELVSSRGDNHYASYTTGSLSLDGNALTTAYLPFGATSGTQYFSDRAYRSSNGWQPFEAQATDRLGVSINTATGATTLTLLSWGNGKVRIPTMQCSDGVMYGFSSDTTHSLYAFSFSEGNVPQEPK